MNTSTCMSSLTCWAQLSSGALLPVHGFGLGYPARDLCASASSLFHT